MAVEQGKWRPAPLGPARRRWIASLHSSAYLALSVR